MSVTNDSSVITGFHSGPSVRVTRSQVCLKRIPCDRQYVITVNRLWEGFAASLPNILPLLFVLFMISSSVLNHEPSSPVSSPIGRSERKPFATQCTISKYITHCTLQCNIFLDASSNSAPSTIIIWDHMFGGRG